VILAVFASATAVVQLRAQTPRLLRQPAAPKAVDARAPNLRVTDVRLINAMRRLVAGSPSAAAVMNALASSGLTVTVGTPAALAALPDSEGGPGDLERHALLAEPGQVDTNPEPPIAWVVFRVAAPPPGADAGDLGLVERVWIAVEADSVEAWIRAAGWADADERIQDDYLAILAHEFAAHVGSIAKTRRLADFCDDPAPGAAPGTDACSIRVENQIRRELNWGLGLMGPRRLLPRRSYALDIMHFARAYHLSRRR
jgi:hypothetical protein